ncbi:hypothetical protein ES708_02243 [subsurface metagenome]
MPGTILGLILIGFLQTACNYIPPVIGQEDILMILASEEDRPLVEPFLLNVFGKEMMTGGWPEPYFKIKWGTPAEFENYKRYKSLIVVSLANPADSTGDLLIRKILGEDRVAQALEGGNPVFVASDYLARGQMFMGLVALDAIQAQEELIRLKDWIFDQFDQQLRIRQHQAIYSRRENKKLAREMDEKYGWSLRFEGDYVTIKERSEENFVWTGRGYPYRWLSVHWVEGADTARITPDWCWRKMDDIAGNLFQSIYIDTLLRSTELGAENGHSILILRGAWGHKEEAGGGPFFTYVFRDREQNRIYFVTGVVFHPGAPKTLLIRRQEIITRTFHTFLKPADAGRKINSNNLT